MEYDLSKMIPNKEEEKNTQSTIVPAEVLMAMGMKPEHLPSQQELEDAQQLIVGAASLMHKRYTGQTEFPISKRQYDQWQNDVKTFSKLVVTGFKPYKDLLAWVETSINMVDEITESLKK